MWAVRPLERAAVHPCAKLSSQVRHAWASSRARLSGSFALPMRQFSLLGCSRSHHRISRSKTRGSRSWRSSSSPSRRRWLPSRWRSTPGCHPAASRSLCSAWSSWACAQLSRAPSTLLSCSSAAIQPLRPTYGPAWSSRSHGRRSHMHWTFWPGTSSFHLPPCSPRYAFEIQGSLASSEGCSLRARASLSSGCSVCQWPT